MTRGCRVVKHHFKRCFMSESNTKKCFKTKKQKQKYGRLRNNSVKTKVLQQLFKKRAYNLFEILKITSNQKGKSKLKFILNVVIAVKASRDTGLTCINLHATLHESH